MENRSFMQWLYAGCGELVGTFLLFLPVTMVSVGTSLGVINLPPGFPINGTVISLTLMMLIIVMGSWTGCHLNPAVTAGLAAIGRFPLKAVPIYMVAQLVGALAAHVVVGLAYQLMLGDDGGLGMPAPAEGVGSWQLTLMEGFGVAILVGIITLATDPEEDATLAPLAIGLALLVGVMVAGPFTGGSLNPAGTLAPMIIMWDFSNCLQYLSGQFVGGIVSALSAMAILAAKKRAAA